MRLLPALLLLAAAGCKTTDAGDDDDTTSDTDPVDDGTHPLVPDEFELLWNVDGECSNEFGDGDQVYVLFEGSVDAEGNLTGTERVWWFYADAPWDEDCVDTWELTGTRVDGEPGALGCNGCEEFYMTRRVRTQDNCSENYDRIYRTDNDGHYQLLMIDTLNEFNDEPNEDNKIGVFHEEKQFGGNNYITKLYASENGSWIAPQGEAHGPPADYRWIGRRCQVSWGGGGGGGGA